MSRCIVFFILIGFIIDDSDAKLQIEERTTHVMQILHDFDKFYDIYLQDEYYTKTISERLEILTTNPFRQMLKKITTNNLKIDFEITNLFFNILMRKSSSTTALFVALQTKFLAIMHAISFCQCGFFASRFEKYAYLKEPCDTVAKYLYIFGFIHNHNLLNRIKNLLDTVNLESNEFNELNNNMNTIAASIHLIFDEEFEKEIVREGGRLSQEDFFKYLTFKIDLYLEKMTQLKHSFKNLMYGWSENISIEEEDIFEYSLDEAMLTWKLGSKLMKKIFEGYVEQTDFRSLAADIIRDINMGLLLQQKPNVLKESKQLEETFKMGMGYDYFLQITLHKKSDKNIEESSSSSSKRDEKYFFKLQKKSEQGMPSSPLQEYSGKSSEKQPAVQYDTLAEVLSNIFEKIQCEIHYVVRKYSKLVTFSTDIIPGKLNNDVVISYAEEKGLIVEY